MLFRSVSGEIAGADGPGMTIKTPVAVIGVRGTTGGGAVGDVAGTGDFQAIVALLAPLIGSLGGIDVIGNAVLTLFVELATAGILSNGDVQPTDFTPELQAALANAIVSLRISLAQMIEELEPGAGGGDIQQGGGDADPAANDFFTPEELQEFGQEFGGSPLGDVASLLGLLEQLAAFVAPGEDPNLPLTNLVEGGGEGEEASVLTALPINMIVTGGALIPQLFTVTGGSSSWDGRGLNESPFIGFVKAETALEGSIFFGVLGGSAVDYLENFGTPEDPQFFFHDKFFKFNAPPIGDSGEQISLSFEYFASSGGFVDVNTVSILTRNAWQFGDPTTEGYYLTSGTGGVDIIYANPFVENYFFSYFSSSDGDGIASTNGSSKVLKQVLEGNGGMDALVGTDGGTAFLGLDGDDYMDYEAIEDLRGGPGDDLLFGLGGRDILRGGPGDDWLFGDKSPLDDGPGPYAEDRFIYDLAENSGNDIIYDIDGGESAPGRDNLELENVAADFDTILELDSDEAGLAGFSVFDDGSDVTVTFGQGGGSTVLMGLGDGSIDTFGELASVINLVVNGTQLDPPP